MPTEYECPGCGYTVIVPSKVAAILGPGEGLGCGNVDEHENGEPLVMWEENDG